MIFKASILALVLPLASATIALTMCEDPRSSSPCHITWTSSNNADPPSFSLELRNVVFNDQYAIGNNVPTSNGQVDITLPTIPARDGYTLEAVDIGNITNVYATTGQFSVGAALSSSTKPTSSGTGAHGTSSVAATSQSSPAGTSTGSSVGSVSGSVSSTSSSTGTTGTQTGSTNTATPSSFNNGATAKHASGSYAALALSAVAGVVFLAL